MVATKEYLLAMHRDIQQFYKDHPGMSYLNKGRYKDFYKDNGAMIDAVNAKITKLQQEHFVFTDDEQPKVKMTPYVPAVAAQDVVYKDNGETKEVLLEAVEAQPAKPSEPVMQEGKTLAEFEKLYDALMQETVNVY